MTEPLMIGTRGWAHRGGDDFYPAELPDDWRFCYYSNQLRSVLVPQATWPETTRADVLQWLEDSDPAFRFLLELPEALCVPPAPAKLERLLDSFLAIIEPIAPRSAGLLMRMAADTPVQIEWFEQYLGRLADLLPVCVDLPAGAWRAAEVQAVLDRQAAGCLWHCAHEGAPRPGGRLLVALAPPAPAREVRRWIEQLAAWQKHGASAGLFLEPGATRVAQEARLIAELMGV